MADAVTAVRLEQGAELRTRKFRSLCSIVPFQFTYIEGSAVDVRKLEGHKRAERAEFTRT